MGRTFVAGEGFIGAGGDGGDEVAALHPSVTQVPIT